MLKRINCKNIVSLFLSDEADTGTGGDQPARNNLTEWNEKGEVKFPDIHFSITVVYA